eukprot:Hpha_TRINITY_DN16183_c0_g1::TRINITY_DN16183_c0_g1_i1::g.8971::m.8971/K16465/CETN1; centrin-1
MANLTEEQIKSTFDLFDADASGAIDADELGLVMEALGFGRLHEGDLEDLVRLLDVDGNGVISYDEFRRAVRARNASKDSAEEIWQAFKSFDHGGKGRVTVEDLERVATSIGEPRRPELYRQVISLLYPQGGEDGIQYEEWKQLCREATSSKRNPVEGDLAEPVSHWRHEPHTAHYYEPEQRERIESTLPYKKGGDRQFGA